MGVGGANPGDWLHIAAPPPLSTAPLLGSGRQDLFHFMMMKTVKQEREEAKDQDLEIGVCPCVYVHIRVNVCASRNTALWGHPHLLCSISEP